MLLAKVLVDHRTAMIDREPLAMSQPLTEIEDGNMPATGTHEDGLTATGNLESGEVCVPLHEQAPGFLTLLRIRDFLSDRSREHSFQLFQLRGLWRYCN